MFFISVNVPPRADNKFSRSTARGLFPNVQVMRGPHWKWKNDDGTTHIYIKKQKQDKNNNPDLE